MSRWFRHYAGLCRDNKLVSAAIRAKQPVERVVWVWAAILENAAELDDGGRYDFDPVEAAYFLRSDEDDILAITEALEASGRLAEGHVVNWNRRQFASDRSRDRVAAFRDRKRAAAVRLPVQREDEESRAGTVTLQPRYGNSPEAETETDKKADADAQSSANASLADRCLAAAGLSADPKAVMWPIYPIAACIRDGASVELDVLPTIQRITASGRNPKSWSYFAQPIMDAKAAREAPAPVGRATGPPRQRRETAGDAAAELEAMFGNPHDPDHSREPSATVPRLAYSAGR